jgi:hypothetical protein
MLETNGLALRFEERFDTQSALDAVYPSRANILDPSTYTLTMTGKHDGARSAKVSYLLVTMPPTPQVANLGAAQAIDTTSDFTLRWNFLSGSLLDIVQFLVLDSSSNIVFASPLPFQPGALNGASTSAIIPANTLPPGQNLVGHLAIARPGLPNTNSYPGAIGIAALAKETAFRIATLRLPILPRLEVLSSNAAPFQLRFTGQTNRSYCIQATEDWRTWQNLDFFNLPTGTGTFTDLQSSNFGQRFYRVRQEP